MIRTISRTCVPVAVNRERLSEEKGRSGDLMRAIEKQRPNQYQGIYVIDPGGKVLAGHGKATEDRAEWPGELRRVVRDAVRAYGKVAPRPAGRFTALADRGVGRRADGSIALAVSLRTLSLGLDPRGYGDVTFDSVVLTKAQREALTPGAVRAGAAWAVPGNVALRLHRLLSPHSDRNTMATADDVTDAGLRGRVDRVRGGVAYLNFTGSIKGVHVWPFPPDKGKKIRASVTLAGVGRCDAKTGELLSITLVGEGAYRGMAPNDEKVPYGAVAEWRRGK